MRARTLRAQIVGWFVGLCASLVVIGCGLIVWNTRGQLYAELDARLQARARALVSWSDWDEHAGAVEFELTEDLADRMEDSLDGTSEQVLSWPEAGLVHARGDTPLPPLPAPDFAAEHDLLAADLWRFANRELAEGDYRICTLLTHTPADPEELDSHDFTLLVRVQESLAPLHAELARLLGFVGLFTLLAAGLALLLGFWLARRLLGPLQELGQAAAQIRAGQPVCLPHRGVDDEVDQLADHLRDAFQRLEEALQRQARFTSDAAHELRNPIAVIQNAAEVALRRERAVADYRHFFADVLSTATRMGRVVDALLLLARLDAGRASAGFQQVDLAALARDSADAQAHGKERIRVLAPDHVLVQGDDGLLRVLLDNLIANALRYSPAERPVEVEIQATDQVILTVRDQGPGIPQEAVGRVFERFARSTHGHDAQDGAGLGLAIVSEVASVHTVRAQVDTSPEGTSIVIRFPRADAAA